MSETIYQLKNGKLYQGTKVVSFIKTSITKYLLINTYLITLLDSIKMNSERNIICFDLSGNIIWQIEQPDKLHESNYYISLDKLSDFELIAFTISGVEAVIDINTGKILSKSLTK